MVAGMILIGRRMVMLALIVRSNFHHFQGGTAVSMRWRAHHGRRRVPLKEHGEHGSPNQEGAKATHRRILPGCLGGQVTYL